MTDSLDLRKQKKAKKPDFRRQDIHKKPRLADVWRKPRGLQSKQRLQKSGHSPIVKTGYGMPGSVKGMHPSGLVPVEVFNVAALDGIDPKEQGIMIRSSVGLKKKIDIVKLAIEKKITILNLKEPQAFIDDLEKKKEAKKKEKTKKKQ